MSAPDSVDLAALARIRGDLEAAENAFDADAIAAHLSDDAVFMVPHVPACEGKGAAVELLRTVFADLAACYDRRIVYTSAEVHVSGASAFDRGTFTVDIRKKDGSDPGSFSGKYFWLYSRDRASVWRLARAIVSIDESAEAEDAGAPIGAPSRIETARLVLRRPVPADVEAIFDRFASDPAVTLYVGWRRHTSRAATEGFIEFSDAEWKRGPAGPYLIASRETDRLLGCTGLSFDTPFRASTGYVLATDAWGQGFATEVLAAMADLARDLGVARLYAIVHPEHPVSMRVLEKCGFTREALLERYSVFPNLSPAPADAVIYTRLLEGGA